MMPLSGRPPTSSSHHRCEVPYVPLPATRIPSVVPSATADFRLRHLTSSRGPLTSSTVARRPRFLTSPCVTQDPFGSRASGPFSCLRLRLCPECQSNLSARLLVVFVRPNRSGPSNNEGGLYSSEFGPQGKKNTGVVFSSDRFILPASHTYEGMRYIVKLDGIYSRTEEARDPRVSCEGECDQASHRTKTAAQRCLIRWLEARAKSFREAANDVRKELRPS